ncbi:hypothetical protein UFOVP116_331 [uncultured Caudovirales phage]|uniref:Uncharacterized protein n=1 Tax=uncultured Caudovirales phage TaxID=2100421 RepID=A0A6J5LAA5_9CAUD|nr:hypothetical protein UFOVP116_331 [uncultured Caudovirales phage]
MGSQYRTASGQVIDMEALRLKNESVIAIGNMRVNARGDELGPGGEVVKDRNQRIAEQYSSSTKVPVDSVVYTDATSALAASSLVADVITAPTAQATPAGGIAAAMAALKKEV